MALSSSTWARTSGSALGLLAIKLSNSLSSVAKFASVVSPDFSFSRTFSTSDWSCASRGSFSPMESGLAVGVAGWVCARAAVCASTVATRDKAIYLMIFINDLGLFVKMATEEWFQEYAGDAIFIGGRKSRQE